MYETRRKHLFDVKSEVHLFIKKIRKCVSLDEAVEICEEERLFSLSRRQFTEIINVYSKFLKVCPLDVLEETSSKKLLNFITFELKNRYFNNFSVKFISINKLFEFLEKLENDFNASYSHYII